MKTKTKKKYIDFIPLFAIPEIKEIVRHKIPIYTDELDEISVIINDFENAIQELSTALEKLTKTSKDEDEKTQNNEGQK